ncbi:MAG: alanine racemase [Lachnospiraceae bacterium]|nr:alanine racemase [Lachnospiraceae bacterium]
MKRTAWAEVDLDRVRHNIACAQEKVGGNVRICGVFKADAYGHGADKLSRILYAEGLIAMAAVGKLSEMESMFAANPDNGMEVLLLGALETAEMERSVSEGKIPVGRAVFSVYNMQQFAAYEEAAERLGKKIRVHIRTDIWKSGMGLDFSEFRSREDEIFGAEHLDVCGLYCHLYSSYSDDRERIQSELGCFDDFVHSIDSEHRKRLTVHIMNSALVFGFPSYGYDMVRVGTAMYGLDSGDGGLLRPAMRICATVFDTRSVEWNAPLSYKPPEGEECGHTRRRIARIMMGFCDCPLLLTQKDIRVWIKGRVFPLADDVCMDNLCIDITGADDIEVGDTAVLLGEEGVTVEEILARNGIDMIHGEWLSISMARLNKVYIGENA